MINNNKSVSFPLANRVCVWGGDRHYSMWHFLPLFLQHRLVHICSLHSVQLLAPPPQVCCSSQWEIKQIGWVKLFPPVHKGKALGAFPKGQACESRQQKEADLQTSPYTQGLLCLFCQPCLFFQLWFLSRTTHHNTPRLWGHIENIQKEPWRAQSCWFIH